MEILMDLMNKHKKSGYKKRENGSNMLKSFEISCKSSKRRSRRRIMKKNRNRNSNRKKRGRKTN